MCVSLLVGILEIFLIICYVMRDITISFAFGVITAVIVVIYLIIVIFILIWTVRECVSLS